MARCHRLRGLGERSLWIALLVWLAHVPSAMGQSPVPNGACFEIVTPASSNAPEVMLLNKCTGDTYVLSRTPRQKGGAKFEWVPTKAGKSAPKGCFMFEGRTFCP